MSENLTTRSSAREYSLPSLPIPLGLDVMYGLLVPQGQKDRVMEISLLNISFSLILWNVIYMQKNTKNRNAKLIIIKQ